jgi:hypothetical protein
MAWTTPGTFNPNALAQSSWMNTHVRDNLIALKSPPTTVITSNTGYSTSATSYVDIDAALSASITTEGGRLLIVCRLIANTFSAARLLLDGVEISQAGSLLANNLLFVTWTAELAVGAHVVKPQWYNSGGTSTMTGFYLALREVS